VQKIKAEPEKPIFIENREELIFVLSEAATLEHMIMCQYLFAAFSLKRGTEEGLTVSQFEAVNRWDRTVSGVAAQEMLHLSLVNNLLSAIGGAPYLKHPNFPQRAKYFPSGVQMMLMPFGDKALRHFLYLERPEGVVLKDAPGFDVHNAAVPATFGDEIVPEEQSFSTVGHLYRGIEEGFRHLTKRYGEKQLFAGPSSAQATSEHFGWKELVEVKDLQSAEKAIETIVEEGEGARGHWENAHYGKFYRAFTDFHEAKSKDPSFEPSRPVVPAYVTPPSDAEGYDMITDPMTCRVAELFNASYEVLLQLLSRFFLHTDTTKDELQALSGTAVDSMFKVIRPLGRLVTTLPVGKNRPGKTAGPCFEMYKREYILPHRHAAWVILHERLLELSEFSHGLAKKYSNLPEVEIVGSSLSRMADTLAPHLKRI
jgi:hypothetical protein